MKSKAPSEIQKAAKSQSFRSTSSKRLVEAGVEKSKRQAREDVTNGAIRVNGEQVKDTEAEISAHPNTNGKFIIIKKGKKNYFSIAVKE